MKAPKSSLAIPCLLLLVFSMAFLPAAESQMITGIWHGKINGQKVEVKIINSGDSIRGTSYYYASAGAYRRYSIKGYFDPYSNEVVWWDDQLLEDRKGGGSLFRGGNGAQLARADFNCPGGAKMMLEGKGGPKEDPRPDGRVYLEKTYDAPLFPDEWDFVVENYTVGANHPDIIDSIASLGTRPVPPAKPEPVVVVTNRPPVRGAVAIPMPTPEVPAQPKTIEEKFVIRKKVFTAEIPLQGDTLELRFFDNVQVDGDSITLFLNEKLIFTHIRLTEKAYVVKLATKDLAAVNELTMVAENLGAIPPNTAYLLAISGGQRYEINLSSTEETSGMIRLVKKDR